VLEASAGSSKRGNLNLVNVGYITQTNTTRVSIRSSGSTRNAGQRSRSLPRHAGRHPDRQEICARLKPPSYGLTVGAQGSLPRFNGAWTLFYTRVTNLTYRNENNFETPIYFGLGTGRNFSDYDQATLRASFMAPRPRPAPPRSCSHPK